MTERYVSESARSYEVKTYRDYLQLPEGEGWELIDGEPYAMVAAPSRRHQKIVLELATAIHSYLKQKGSCQVYIAPFAVRLLSEGEQEQDCRNVVQPDISVICDHSKLDERGCLGAPDWIIEVVSKGNPSHDYVRKLGLYERFGIREYWIVNPEARHILIYRLDKEGSYGAPVIVREGERIGSGLFPELEIDLGEILQDWEGGAKR